MNNDKQRESIIASSLVLLCLAALILGLFLIKKNVEQAKDNSRTKLMDSLRRDKVAVIGLEGLIFDTFHTRAAFKNFLNVPYVKKQLKSALKDEHTKAVLMRVNSPGGTVAASQEIYDLIQKLRANDKPVVISMSDVCASGCYYIASAADKIVANPGTVTGSIGVISQNVNLKGLLDKLGIVDQTIKAGKYKDMGSATRDLTVEEREILQNLLNSSYKQFLDDVEQGRGIARERLEEIAQGLVYTGMQALDVGLVDSLGNYDDAKEVTRAILKDSYNYSKSDKIKFEETWKSNKLSSIDDLLDLGLSKIMHKLGLNKLATGSLRDTVYSRFQPLWLMQ